MLIKKLLKALRITYRFILRLFFSHQIILESEPKQETTTNEVTSPLGLI